MNPSTPIIALFVLQGMPTHDAAGKELSKSQLKKLAKLYEAQKKKYEDYLKSQSGGTGDQAPEGARAGAATSEP